MMVSPTQGQMTQEIISPLTAVKASYSPPATAGGNPVRNDAKPENRRKPDADRR